MVFNSRGWWDWGWAFQLLEYQWRFMTELTLMGAFRWTPVVQKISFELSVVMKLPWQFFCSYIVSSIVFLFLLIKETIPTLHKFSQLGVIRLPFYSGCYFFRFLSQATFLQLVKEKFQQWLPPLIQCISYRGQWSTICLFFFERTLIRFGFPAKDELPRESYVDIVALRKYNLDCIRCVMQHDEKLEPGHGPGPESRPGPGV